MRIKDSTFEIVIQVKVIKSWYQATKNIKHVKGQVQKENSRCRKEKDLNAGFTQAQICENVN